MEFKYRAVDNVTLTATSHSPSPVTYLPHQSLELNGGFSGFRPPVTGEEALRRELEKEVIRREILRRMELEEEVKRELAMERELGISISRPLNIQGLLSQWSNSTVMNPAVGPIGASRPPLTLPPTEINPSPENSNNDKVIVLEKPDPELFNAKRKAAILADSETEPSTFGLKKKLKEEWSCALCEIKATSKSGMNAHLNGKKHKSKEARQKKICKSNEKCEKIVNAKTIEIEDTVMVHKGVNEFKNEEQPIETSAENDVCMIKLKNDEKLTEMMIHKDENNCENEELLVDKSQCVSFSESNDYAAIEEEGKKNA